MHPSVDLKLSRNNQSKIYSYCSSQNQTGMVIDFLIISILLKLSFFSVGPVSGDSCLRVRSEDSIYSLMMMESFGEFVAFIG